MKSGYNINDTINEGLKYLEDAERDVSSLKEEPKRQKKLEGLILYAAKLLPHCSSLSSELLVQNRIKEYAIQHEHSRDQSNVYEKSLYHAASRAYDKLEEKYGIRRDSRSVRATSSMLIDVAAKLSGKRRFSDKTNVDDLVTSELWMNGAIFDCSPGPYLRTGYLKRRSLNRSPILVALYEVLIDDGVIEPYPEDYSTPEVDFFRKKMQEYNPSDLKGA